MAGAKSLRKECAQRTQGLALGTANDGIRMERNPGLGHRETGTGRERAKWKCVQEGEEKMECREGAHG